MPQLLLQSGPNQLVLPTPVPAPPSAPILSAGAVTSSSVALSWTPVLTATSFVADYATNAQFTAGLVTNVAAGSGTSFTVTGLLPVLQYWFRVRAVNSLGQSCNSNNVTATTTGGIPQQLLPAQIPVVRAKSVANTTDWQNFKASLDASLNVVLGSGGFEGSTGLNAISYTVGYQALVTVDAVTANKYRDKALGLVNFWLRGNQRGGYGACQYVGRGDGVTTSFTLANTPTQNLMVTTSPVSTAAVTKGSHNGVDGTTDVSATVIKVSKTNDGAPDYVEGVDWQQGPLAPNGTGEPGQVDWSLGSANQPTTGATYYVTTADKPGTAASVTPSGATITFSSAPSSSTAIFAQYLYTDPVTGLTLQQTFDNCGYYDNGLTDSIGYDARYLWMVALASDWAWADAAYPAAMKSFVLAWLNNLSNLWRDQGYKGNSPASNYGAGQWAARVAVAVHAQNRDLTNAARLLSEVNTYWTANVLPLFSVPPAGSGSLVDGHWSEGWDYGPLAALNVLVGARMLSSWTGLDVSAARGWANDVIRTVMSESMVSDCSIMYSGGDVYQFPAALQGPTDMMAVAQWSATDGTAQGYAAKLIANIGDPGNWASILFLIDSVSPVPWYSGGSALPLARYTRGTGVTSTRSAWYGASTWLMFHCGNILNADHQATDQSTLELWHGTDPLLVNVCAALGIQGNFQARSSLGNLVVINDHGAGDQTYPGSQAEWYTPPNGCTTDHFEDKAAYTFVSGTWWPAYGSAFSGTPNPLTEGTRDVLFLRGAGSGGSDYVVFHDRLTPNHATYGVSHQLWFRDVATASASGAGFTETLGSSRLFGAVFSSVPVASTLTSVPIPGFGSAQLFATAPTGNNARTTFTAALQSAASSVGSMDAVAYLTSGDGQLEGVTLGSTVVLFVQKPPFASPSTYSVTFGNGVMVTHYITGLTPGTVYHYSGAANGTVTASAAGIITFTTTGTGSSQTLTVASMTFPWLNVADYGAKGDGSTDDTTAIQNAINAAPAAGGVVCFPPGTFRVSSITYNPNVSLVGSGMNVTTLKSNAASSLLLYTTATFAQGVGTIRDLTLDGNSQGTYGLNLTGMIGLRVDRVWIQNFTVAGMNLPGVELSDFHSMVITACVTGVKAAAVNGFSTNANTFYDCRIDTNSSWAVDWSGGNELRFDNCDFEVNGTTGNSGTGCIRMQSYANKGHALTMRGCWMEQNKGGFGVQLGQASAVMTSTIENCQLFDSPNTVTGVSVDGTGSAHTLVGTGGCIFGFGTTNVSASGAAVFDNRDVIVS